VERRDLLVVVIGLIIVAAIALVASPPGEENERPSVPQVTVEPTLPAGPVDSPAPAPTITEPHPAPVQKFGYASEPLSYPLHKIPENMNIFGASDPEWPHIDWVSFAVLEKDHGGLSETFTVAYPVWKVVCRLNATTHPLSARLQWVLVDAVTGSIVEGAELFTGGTVNKTVQISRTPMYFIISARDADSFTLTLETTANHSAQALSGPESFKIV
jgi:hypothetical protein